ncbi:MAG: hypothetical protein C3F15_10910 [Holophagae bacterium]|nr:MAG: hypothetical protein C3F15_10910 [Holophagae bacterium]
MDSLSFSPDIQEFLRLLHVNDVRYLIVGGEAVIFYGHARLTGDVDFFYDVDVDNARRLYSALDEFWEGSVPGVTCAEELAAPGLIVQFGVPPNRIDLMNRIDGVDFGEAWRTRNVVSLEIGGQVVPVNYVGLDALMANKRAAARPKDMDDLPYLTEALRSKGCSD